MFQLSYLLNLFIFCVLLARKLLNCHSVCVNQIKLVNLRIAILIDGYFVRFTDFYYVIILIGYY